MRKLGRNSKVGDLCILKNDYIKFFRIKTVHETDLIDGGTETYYTMVNVVDPEDDLEVGSSQMYADMIYETNIKNKKDILDWIFKL